MEEDKLGSKIPSGNENIVNSAEEKGNSEQIESTSDLVTESLHEESGAENSDNDMTKENVDMDNDNVHIEGDTGNGISDSKEEPSKKISKKEKKKATKKKVTVVHPFLERAGRKLGNIKKKMALLKQNLKEIQAKKALRQAEKDGSELESIVSPLGNEDSSKGSHKGKAASLRKLPAFIKINQEESDLGPDSFKRGKRYIDVDNTVPEQTKEVATHSSLSTSLRRKRNMTEELAISDQGTESLPNQVSGSKKIRRSTDTIVSTSSGSMIVSEKDMTDTLKDAFKSPRNAKSQKG